MIVACFGDVANATKVSNRSKIVSEPLRTFLRIGPVNRAVRAAGRLFIHGPSGDRFQRRLPLIAPFEIEVPCGEVIHWLPNRDACSKFLKYGGWDGYEGATVRVFRELALRSRVVFDIGAYIGYFAFLAAAARPGVRAHAFEAISELAAHARAIAGMNPSLAVEIVESAMGSSVGVAEFFFGGPWSSDSSLNSAHRPNRRPRRVPMTTIDHYVASKGIDALDLMKIDTETTEPEVLKGGEAAIKRFRPYIVAEVLPTADIAALTSFQASQGYACARITGAGLAAEELRSDADQGDAGPANWLFFPQELPGPCGEVVTGLLGASRDAAG